MREAGQILGSFYEGFVFVYGVSLLLIYAFLAFVSIIAIRFYLRADSYADYTTLLSSDLAPGISVIAPAFNEGNTIIANARSLLTLKYPLFEVIIINDGSTDDTLQQLIDEFSLTQVNFAYDPKIKSEPIKTVYKSTNPSYSRLVVVDKFNGGSKADASNAGINVSSFPYFLCTDVDCILEKDTLLKMIKPILSEDEKRVIAVGATLRMANSCVVDSGVITNVRAPRKLLPRFQELEYVRSYVVGKMGWSYINSVPNVSGGLGLFDKEISVKCGGYDSDSFGEDMEMLTRMRAYSEDNNIKSAIRYIPITLCWTEGPATLKTLARQRTRWSRGLAQIIYTHFNIMFNPSYGRLGMITFPYNFFFELLAPIIETLGLIYYVIIILTGEINWPFAIVLFIFVYTYAIMISTLSVLWDQLIFDYYRTAKDVIRICIMVFVEMFIYHPLIVFFALRGYFYFLSGRKLAWGNMQRQGFGQQSQVSAR